MEFSVRDAEKSSLVCIPMTFITVVAGKLSLMGVMTILDRGGAGVCLNPKQSFD